MSPWLADILRAGNSLLVSLDTFNGVLIPDGCTFRHKAQAQQSTLQATCIFVECPHCHSQDLNACPHPLETTFCGNLLSASSLIRVGYNHFHLSLCLHAGVCKLCGADLCCVCRDLGGDISPLPYIGQKRPLDSARARQGHGDKSGRFFLWGVDLS